MQSSDLRTFVKVSRLVYSDKFLRGVATFVCPLNPVHVNHAVKRLWKEMIIRLWLIFAAQNVHPSCKHFYGDIGGTAPFEESSQ